MGLEFLTLDEARLHCKADGEDDDLILSYAEAAEVDAVLSVNRVVFKDQPAMDAAISELPALMAAARQARDDALAAAEEIEDAWDRAESLSLAQQAYRSEQFRWAQIRNGIVINENLKGAMLMTVAHRYQNRANVVAGQGAAAVQVPLNAEWIYKKHRYMGELV